MQNTEGEIENSSCCFKKILGGLRQQLIARVGVNPRPSRAMLIAAAKISVRFIRASKELA